MRQAFTPYRESIQTSFSLCVVQPPSRTTIPRTTTPGQLPLRQLSHMTTTP